MEWWNYPEEAWGTENLIFINWSWTRVAQWWEHSPATNVVIRILVLMPYVDWVCCWFSPLLREVFLWVLRFSPVLKNQHFQIPIQPGMHRHVSTSSWELLIAPWVNKLQWQYKSHEHSLSWLKMEIGLLALRPINKINVQHWIFALPMSWAHGHKPCTADPNKSPKVNNGLYKSQDFRQVKKCLILLAVHSKLVEKYRCSLPVYLLLSQNNHQHTTLEQQLCLYPAICLFIDYNR